jgi:Kef-type K+ transport system membrane component KefB
MVGLELDFKRIKQLGKVSLAAGLGQIVFTFALGFMISLLLGFSSLASVFIAIAISFSSTIVVIKLLTEKKDLQSLYGRICVGFLLVQDFVAMGILLILGSSAANSHDVFAQLPGWQFALALFVKALIITLMLVWLSRNIFPRFMNRLGKSDELLLIFSLAWALGMAALISSPLVGFSLEVGGFLAGLALANSHIHFEIGARIRSLRDFFIVIFFIVFGTKLVFSGITTLFVPALILSLFVLIGNPLIIMLILGYLGYKPRTSFFASMAVAQISEFSFIVVALGNRLGYVPDQVLSLVTLVGIITITASSYMIINSHKLYAWLRPFLEKFDFQHGSAEKKSNEELLKNHTVLVGVNRLGSHLVNVLQNTKHQLVLVDFDPLVAGNYVQKGYNVICGDITDPYIQEQVNLEQARLIISTVPDFDDNLMLAEAVRLSTSGKTKRPKLIFVAQNEQEVKDFYGQDIDYVLSPHFIGGLHLAKLLEEDQAFKELKKLKARHLKNLGL